MTLTYISCSSDFYTFYVNVPLSLGCMIRKVSAEDIAIRGNGSGLEYMCPTRHFVYIFFNPVFQVSTAKNEINLFNNHILIVASVTFAPAGAMTPSAEFLLYVGPTIYSRLSLSRIPRDSLKYFEISVPRHIRFEELRKKIIRTTEFNKFICNWTLEVRDIVKILWKRGTIAP